MRRSLQVIQQHFITFHKWQGMCTTMRVGFVVIEHQPKHVKLMSVVTFIMQDSRTAAWKLCNVLPCCLKNYYDLCLDFVFIEGRSRSVQWVALVADSVTGDVDYFVDCWWSWWEQYVLIIIIALRGKIWDFFNLLTVPETVASTMSYTQVSWVQIMCNTSRTCHVQHAVCHLVQRDSSVIKC